jgi:hypothetical protein
MIYRSLSVLVIIYTLFSPVFNSCVEDPPRSPRLITCDVSESDITSTTATLKGELTDPGTMKIEEYGIIISKNMLFDPFISEKSIQTAIPGVFQFQFTGLEPGTRYFFKAYALVNTAMVFSERYKEFTTKPAP